MTKTKTNTARRAGMTGNAVALWPSARYQGAAARGVVRQASLPINIGGGLEQRYAFRPEGVAGGDRHQLQS